MVKYLHALTHLIVIIASKEDKKIETTAYLKIISNFSKRVSDLKFKARAVNLDNY